MQDTDECVETVIGHVQETVLSPDALQNTAGPVQRRPADSRHRGIFQGTSRKRGELHQILVVLVASSAQDSVPLPKVQLAEYTPQQVFRHILVIDKSQRLSFLPALEALRYLLENAAALVIVYLHLGIAGELEGIGAE